MAVAHTIGWVGSIVRNGIFQLKARRRSVIHAGGDCGPLQWYWADDTFAKSKCGSAACMRRITGQFRQRLTHKWFYTFMAQILGLALSKKVAASLGKCCNRYRSSWIPAKGQWYSSTVPVSDCFSHLSTQSLRTLKKRKQIERLMAFDPRS